MAPLPLLCAEGGAVPLPVRARPRASRPGLAFVRDGRPRIRLASAPCDGRADAGLTGLLARLLGVPSRRVALEGEAAGRREAVRGEEPGLADAERLRAGALP